MVDGLNSVLSSLDHVHAARGHVLESTLPVVNKGCTVLFARETVTIGNEVLDGRVPTQQSSLSCLPHFRRTHQCEVQCGLAGFHDQRIKISSRGR
ncbi:hypothetical protein PJL18_03548 [Paenarthrobacter nicotinovorans]|nr:hypothetical protein [Paenarthrobacter nicotinovorans]